MGSARRAAALLAVAVLTLLALEVGARAVFPLPEALNFSRLSYSEKTASLARRDSLAMANATTWWQSQPDRARFVVRMNLYGFRDRTWSLEKPAGTRRIAFVGDSFVEGLGARDGETIPVRFSGRAAAAGERLDVLNLGASGFGFQEYLPLIRDAVRFFRPDDLVLVVYMNDLYSLPNDAGALLSAGAVPHEKSPWGSRLLWAARRLHAGRRVPVRWHHYAGAMPVPMPSRALLDDPSVASKIDRFVASGPAAAMRAGRLNPAVTNLLSRSERVLPRPVDMEPLLRAVQSYLAMSQVRFWLVYLPSLNQVSDAYLPAQRELSAPIEAASLTEDRFQRQARDISAAATRLGIHFLDLTPVLRTAEDRGRRLYWAYDGHMRSAGYAVVADAVWRWWSGNP